MNRKVTSRAATRAGVRSRLKELARLAGSQANLARALDLSPKYIGKWTSGYVTPRTDTYIEVANKLGVSLDWLIMGTGKAPRQLEVTSKRRKAA